MSVIGTPQHTISVVVGGRQIVGWLTYEIEIDMQRMADAFSMRMPFDRETWDLCRPDREIVVQIDNTPVLTGFLDEEYVPEDDECVEIVGRDRAGRLTQESAPSFNFAGLGIFEAIAKVADPWFPVVTHSNARNRTLIRGRGRKAKAAAEPVKLNTRVGTQIEPGQKRGYVIQTVCEQAGYFAWSSGDGRELVVGKPNYDQEPQFRFFMPKKNSPRSSEATVRGMGIRNSVADRYSQIVVVGAGVGTTANYGAAVASRYGTSKNNSLTTDGTGRDFTYPKRLVIQNDVASAAEARELAEREMAQRDGHGKGITVRCAGHGQVIAGAYTTLFAPDTIASVEDERTGTKGMYLITSCTYRSDRQGEETLMHLVPRGTELTFA